MDEPDPDMTPLPEDFARDMELAGRTGPTEAERRKIITGLGPLLPGGGGGGAGGGEPVAVAGPRLGASLSWVGAAATVALLVGATSLGAWLFGLRSETPSAAPAAIEEPPDVTPSLAVEAAPEPTAPTAHEDEFIGAAFEPTVRAEPGARRPEPPGEVELLDAARGALARNPGRSLRYLRRHATLYRDGVFEEEREVLAVEVLIRLGRWAPARARAARFTAAHPSSAHRPRLEQLLSQGVDP